MRFVRHHLEGQRTAAGARRRRTCADKRTLSDFRPAVLLMPVFLRLPKAEVLFRLAELTLPVGAIMGRIFVIGSAH